MKVPVGTNFRIVAYRGFYDLPRIILAESEKSLFWIFYSPFDDDFDEYPDSYAVFFVGADENDARAALDEYCAGRVGRIVETIPISRFEFDQGRHSSFIVR